MKQQKQEYEGQIMSLLKEEIVSDNIFFLVNKQIYLLLVQSNQG